MGNTVTTAQWEVVVDICEERGISVDKTDRLRIPGGWLYRTTLTTPSLDFGSSVVMAFVPEVAAHCSNCCPTEDLFDGSDGEVMP